MSDSSQTATNKPSDPVLCKMGCGFFGSSATGDCCSKCFREMQKKDGVTNEPAPRQLQPSSSMMSSLPEQEEEPQPMEVDEGAVCEPAAAVGLKKEEAPVVAAASAKPAPAQQQKKKKKKKASYKSMMAGMMKSSPERDAEKEKETIRKVTGGGAFSKIDKI